MTVSRLIELAFTKGLRRGFRGEPIWLAVALVAWLARRSLNEDPVLWRGEISQGHKLTVVAEPGRSRRSRKDW